MSDHFQGIQNQQYTGDKPMTKREQIAAMMMHAHMVSGYRTDDEYNAENAVNAADALIAELKRRKEPEL